MVRQRTDFPTRHVARLSSELVAVSRRPQGRRNGTRDAQSQPRLTRSGRLRAVAYQNDNRVLGLSLAVIGVRRAVGVSLRPEGPLEGGE